MEAPAPIGRRHELEQLETWTSEAWSRVPRLVTVVGEAGTGKSTLIDHATARWNAEGAQVAVAACQQGLALPILPILAALRLDPPTGGSSSPVKGSTPGSMTPPMLCGARPMSGRCATATSASASAIWGAARGREVVIDEASFSQRPRNGDTPLGSRDINWIGVYEQLGVSSAGLIRRQPDT